MSASISQREEAANLFALGFSKSAISRVVGVRRSTIGAWLDPDHLAKQRARRMSYRKPCPRCGKLMDGSRGHSDSPKHCSQCTHELQHENRYWTAERVVEAIRRWAAIYGEPPSANHWLHRNPEGYPGVAIAQREFGSWSAAVEAAGFPRPENGRYPRTGEKGLSREQHRILALLAIHGPCTTNRMCELTGRHRNGVHKSLYTLEHRSLVKRSSRGHKHHPAVWSLCD